MTRKDYEVIAAAVNRARLHFEGRTEELCGIERTARELADALVEDSDRFQHQRFMVACGFPDTAAENEEFERARRADHPDHYHCTDPECADHDE